MRHFNGDADNFTQNYTDGDTAWRFVETETKGEWHIINSNASDGHRFLSAREDSVLRVPSVGEQPSEPMRRWRIEDILDAPVIVVPELSAAMRVKDLFYQLSAQTLLCLLRGPPPSAEEKSLHKWITSGLFSGDFVSSETSFGLAANQELLGRLGLVDQQSDVPFDGSAYQTPQELLDYLRKSEPKSFQRKNLSAVRELTVQIRTEAFAVVLKHNNQIDLAEEVSQALQLDVKAAEQDHAASLNTLKQTWATLMPLQTHFVMLFSAGEDVKALGSLALERLSLLSKLQAAAPAAVTAAGFSEFPLERLQSLELLRQKSNEATDGKVTAEERARNRWSKTRKVLSLLRNTMAPISRLKAVLKAREGVAEQKEKINPAVTLILDVVEFIKLPVDVSIEQIHKAMEHQRLRALGRVLALYVAKQFVGITQDLDTRILPTSSSISVLPSVATHPCFTHNPNSTVMRPLIRVRIFQVWVSACKPRCRRAFLLSSSS